MKRRVNIGKRLTDETQVLVYQAGKSVEVLVLLIFFAHKHHHLFVGRVVEIIDAKASGFDFVKPDSIGCPAGYVKGVSTQVVVFLARQGLKSSALVHNADGSSHFFLVAALAE